MKEYKTINLLELIPKNILVTLEDNFRNKLFAEAFKIYNGVTLVRKVGGYKGSYRDWSNGRRTPSLDIVMKLVKLTKTSKKEFLSNIKSLTAYYRAGSIRIKDFNLIFDPEMAEWFGLVKGDGCISKKYIAVGNTKLALIFQFIEFLEKRFGIEKKQFEITLRLPPEKTEDNFKDIIFFIKERGYNRVIIRKKRENLKRKQLLFEARFNSKLLATIMSKIQGNLYKLLINSPSDVKSAFIRGYCAAEGSVTDRRVTISQNNYNELKFIKSLLLSMGFNNVSEPTKGSGAYRICIYTKKELEKFYKEIGFGKHKLRNDKLKKLIDSYIYDYSLHKTKEKRYEELLNIIKNNPNKTAKFITSKTNIIYKCISQLLKEMTDLNIIKVNKTSKPYLYFVDDSK